MESIYNTEEAMNPDTTHKEPQQRQSPLAHLNQLRQIFKELFVVNGQFVLLVHDVVVFHFAITADA